MPRILYKYPTRERPLKFFESLDNFYRLVTHDDYVIVVTLDVDDPTATTDEFKKRILEYPKLQAFWGTSTGKISALNRDIVFFDNWDILVVLADDMVLKEGFDVEILKAFEDGFSGLVHFNDGIANAALCTFPVMDRAYYDLFGYVYNPVYKSVAADNEQHEMAVLLKRYKHVPGVDIVRHLHPAYGMAPMDDLYRRNEAPALYAEDLNTLRNRRAENFGIKP